MRPWCRLTVAAGLLTLALAPCSRGWSLQMLRPGGLNPSGAAQLRKGVSAPRSNFSMRIMENGSGAVWLKETLASLFATAVVLGTGPVSAALADSAALPAVVQTAGLAVSTTPTAKLEGELLGQFKKAQAAGSLAQFDKAMKLYSQVVKYAPGYVYGWSNRGNVMVAEGDLNGAISDYSKALELAGSLNVPDMWMIYLNRGTTYLAMGETGSALADLDQAATLNTRKDLYTLASRAQVYERMQEWGKALQDYEGAVGQRPGDVQPWWLRFALVMYQENLDFDSLTFLRRVQSKFGDVAEVKAALTAVQFGRGETHEAEALWASIAEGDQKIFLDEVYLKNKLKWPPRVGVLIQGVGVWCGCCCSTDGLSACLGQFFLFVCSFDLAV
ncbi:unnamed protein product [Discosporangium mesarthrocarpum]